MPCQLDLAELEIVLALMGHTNSNIFTRAWWAAVASLPSKVINRFASMSGNPEREMATAKAPKVAYASATCAPPPTPSLNALSVSSRERPPTSPPY